MSKYSLMRYFYVLVFLFSDNALSAAELYDVQPKEEQHEVMHASLRVNRGFLKNNASRFDLSGAEQVVYTDPRTKQSIVITEDNEDAKTDTESITAHARTSD